MKVLTSKNFWKYAIILMLVAPLSMNCFAIAENNSSTEQPFVSVLDSPNSLQLEHRAQVSSSMSNLFGLDMSKYNVTLTKHNLETNGPNKGRTGAENLKYNLSTSGGNFITISADISGDSVYYLLSYFGNDSIHYSQALPQSLSDKASAILNRYQTLKSGASYIEPMLEVANHNSLDQLVTTAKSNKNGTASIVENNLKMEITSNDYHTAVYFKPSFEGFDYPNVLSMRFDNRLNVIDGFSDRWTTYKIGDTHVKISMDEAVDLAWKAANNISTVTIFGVGDVYIHLIKDPLVSISGAVRDNMTAYPLYWIRIPTDKVYYTIDQVQVGVWADTGEIAYCQATGFEGQPEPNGEVAPSSSVAASATPATSEVTDANAASNNTALIIAAVTCGFIAVAAVTLVAVKKRNHRGR